MTIKGKQAEIYTKIHTVHKGYSLKSRTIHHNGFRAIHNAAMSKTAGGWKIKPIFNCLNYGYMTMGTGHGVSCWIIKSFTKTSKRCSQHTVKGTRHYWYILNKIIVSIKLIW